MGLFSTLGNIAGVVAAPVTGGASLAPMLIGAGLGAAKHFMVDKPEQERSAKLTADIMRYSPWTGMQGPGIKYAPGLFSSALQGGAMGATAGNMLASAPAAGAINVGDSAAKTASSVQGTLDNMKTAGLNVIPQMPTIPSPAIGNGMFGSGGLGYSPPSLWSQMKPLNRTPMYATLGK